MRLFWYESLMLCYCMCYSCTERENGESTSVEEKMVFDSRINYIWVLLCISRFLPFVSLKYVAVNINSVVVSRGQPCWFPLLQWTLEVIYLICACPRGWIGWGVLGKNPKDWTFSVDLFLTYSADIIHVCTRTFLYQLHQNLGNLLGLVISIGSLSLVLGDDS